MKDFQVVQRQLTDHIRNPDQSPAPSGVSSERMAIYRSLVFKNLEGLVSGAFPVCKSLYPEQEWQQIIHTFLLAHRCESPYFLDVAKEFLSFLEGREQLIQAKPFLYELAHYEWVEMVLDVSPQTLPSEQNIDKYSVLAEPVSISPLALNLSYYFPVHMIGVEFQLDAPPNQATCLVVYRDQQDRVQFIETNPVTHQLLSIVESKQAATGAEALLQLAEGIEGMSYDQISGFGEEILYDFLKRRVLLPAN